jgi:predicted phosphodiesterase
MRIPAPAALLAAMVAGRVSASGPLARGPYLQRPGDSTIAVHWETFAPSVGSVEYRLDRPPAQAGPTLRTEESPAADEVGRWQRADEPAQGTSHRIALSNLAPGAVYAYRVLADGEPLSATLHFRAPRCPDDSTVAFGVIGDTTGGTIPSALAADLSAEGVDFVLHAGDVNYPDGRLEDYDVNFFVPFAPLLATTPILPILGDHDVRTSDGAPFLQVFDLPDNGVTPEPRFYSFRQGDAEFFCLDVESSAYGEDSDQYRWLERSLKSSTAAWKFVAVFEPPFTSENSNVVERLVLSPLFERYGVDVVFSGHEHLYERTRPISLWGPPGTPVVYVVEGGGGSVLSTADPESFSAFLASVFGYVTVRISGDTLVLDAHDATGAVIDETALVKPSVPPADGRSCDPAPFSLRVDTGQRLSGEPPRP